MKGKSKFTKSEADRIISFIKQKLKADTNGQKSVRTKIRNLGFYAKDDFGITGGYTVEDFLSVATIEEGLPSNKNEPAAMKLTFYISVMRF